tara:strand:+ start:1021 stop:1482 length:462 start_codon:yes stop_codon:yes gene_type:complete
LDKKSSDIINQFKLLPHPEGGWFREILRSESYVTRKDGEKRNNITGIYYMLCKYEISTWHRVNSSDEIWIYIKGAPLNLWCLDDGNKELRKFRIDSNNPIEMIPSGHWQAATSHGAFTLVSCCVGPGFDFLDFEMLKNIDPSLRPTKALKELM